MTPTAAGVTPALPETRDGAQPGAAVPHVPGVAGGILMRNVLVLEVGRNLVSVACDPSHPDFMMISMLKSKLHRATVTDANVNYEGSITVSEDLMNAAGFLRFERVLVGNMRNGERFETYMIKGPRGKGEICLNGATARLGRPGDLLTIMSFVRVSAARAKRHRPNMITLQKGNRLPRRR